MFGFDEYGVYEKIWGRREADMTRIDDTFARLKADGKKAFVSYIMAGDPDYDTALHVLKGLPEGGR